MAILLVWPSGLISDMYCMRIRLISASAKMCEICFCSYKMLSSCLMTALGYYIRPWRWPSWGCRDRISWGLWGWRIVNFITFGFVEYVVAIKQWRIGKYGLSLSEDYSKKPDHCTFSQQAGTRTSGRKRDNFHLNLNHEMYNTSKRRPQLPLLQVP